MASLAEVWCEIPGMDARGASGRLVVGPVHLKREDLDFNYMIVGRAIEWVGCRPSIEPLTDAVADFFHATRVKGRTPATRAQAQKHDQTI